MMAGASSLPPGPNAESPASAAEQQQCSSTSAAAPAQQSPDILWLRCRVQWSLPPQPPARVSAGADLGINRRHWRSLYIATFLSQMQGHFFFPPMQNECVRVSPCFPKHLYMRFTLIYTKEAPKFALNTDELCLNWIPNSASVILPLTGGTQCRSKYPKFALVSLSPTSSPMLRLGSDDRNQSFLLVAMAQLQC